MRQLLRKLPLLDIEKNTFIGSVDLSDTVIVCVQHLCWTTYALFEALFDLGLQKSNLFVLGKCYSTNPEVYFQLLEDGVKVSPASLHFNSHYSYDEFFDQSADSLVEQLICSEKHRNCEKIIFLDDGGHLIERANLLIPESTNSVGVEQTSSGYNRLKSKFIQFPIINTARSWLKLEYESPIIVDLVQKKLFESLDLYATAHDKILLIGGGSLGNYTYETLNSQFDISVFDICPQKTNFPSSQFRKRLSEFDIIIGCTGHISLPYHEHRFLKKSVLLASISSSDREFDAQSIRKQCKVYYDCHRTVELGGIKLLNSGFPITFGNDFEEIDTDDYQLTRALLFSSICQANLSDPNQSGFLDVDETIQMRILENLKKKTYVKSEKSNTNHWSFARTG